MSKVTFDEIFAPVEARYKEELMQRTWGHLALEKNKSYKGWLLFCWASDGTLVPIDYEFEGLNGSPWLYNAIIDFIDAHRNPQGKVQKWEGEIKNYKLRGKIHLIDTM